MQTSRGYLIPDPTQDIFSQVRDMIEAVNTDIATRAAGLGVDANTTGGETRALIYDITAGTLRRVSIGPADSGGTGFRVLRIPN